MPTWIDLDGLDNMRDLGGLATADGAEVQPGRLLRSDNLQDLTDADITRIVDAGVTDIVDLRSDTERRSTGPGRMDGHEHVALHPHSFFFEDDADDDVVPDAALPGEALPWNEAASVDLGHPVASSYAHMVTNRADTAVAALRVIAGAAGGTLIHCAAGKDRTGIVSAFALELAGVPRQVVVADYAATSERIAKVIERNAKTPTYADALAGADPRDHDAVPETMERFLAWVDEQGGPAAILARAGWTDADTTALRAKLLTP